MKHKIVLTIFICIVMLFSMSVTLTADSSEINYKHSISKLGWSVKSSVVDEQQSNEILDVLVACDSSIAFDYVARTRQSIPNIEIATVWEYLGGFRASIKCSDIMKLARNPFVTRIDMNSNVSLCMDDARSYTNVDWWESTMPQFDGDKDGSPTSYSKNDIVIAVLDTGIDTGHHDLDGGKVIGWKDIWGANNGDEHFQPHDGHGHGTHCAAIAASSGDVVDAYPGVARYAALVGVRIFNDNAKGEKSDAIDGLNWVAQYSYTYGIEIVSCSWGWEDFGQYDILAGYADQLVETYGLVVCVAAGRDGPDSDTIRTPGTAKYVITVGRATDPGEGDGWSLSSDSSRGPCDDGRIKPDILAPGTAITAAKAGTTMGFETYSGSSMATAFVAGMAALWLDRDYSLRFAVNDYHPHPRIKKLLMASAVDVPGDTNPGVDNAYGAGGVCALSQDQFYDTDISTSSSNAPTALSYSWSLHEYDHSNEPLWVYDPGQDWYKIYCYSSLFIAVYAQGDPDLVLRIKIYDRYVSLLTQSSALNYATIGYFAQYSGAYYIQIIAEQYSGDYYDITIMTTPS